MPTDNLGPVSARCALDISEADCLRTLKDQACKLGGDVVWGVNEAPILRDERNHYEGRAAHTRVPKPNATPSP